MQIDLIYDGSVADAPSGFTAALEAAAQFLDNLIINPITVNIEVGWQEDQGEPLTGDTIGLGGPSGGTYLSYSQLRSDLAANATSTADTTALASLPLADPTGGGRYYVSYAQEKALGLMSATSSEIDGAVGFGGDATFDFSTNDLAVPGEIDFLGVAEHELTHALGRTSGLQQDGSGRYTVMDLFRYASPGVRQLGTGEPAYFSINGGNTDLDNYDTSSDLADWASSVSGDSFGAVSYPGIANVVTQSDVTELDVIGFDVGGTAVTLSISGTAANQAMIDQSTIQPFSQVSISDQNINQTETVTVTLSSAANGTLTNVGSGSYNPSTGVYTVVGSVATVNAALDALTFNPTVDQVPAGDTVTTNFTLTVTDSARASATDTATSVVAVSSGSSGRSGNLQSVSLPSGGSFDDSGIVTLGTTVIGWAGRASVAEFPSSDNWTAYAGTMAQEILAAQSPVASDVPDTQFTNPVLTALGLPFNAQGLALWGDPSNNAADTSATDTIAYSFSSAVPTGTPFLLWAPGGAANGNDGPDTFTVNAWLNGTPVSTAGWTFSVEGPFGSAPSSTYTVNAATGQVTATAKSDPLFPDAVIVITPNAPINALQVTASTIPFDFWGLAFPSAPEAVTSAFSGSCTVTGVGGATLSLPFDTQTTFNLVQPLLTSISAGVVSGSILPAYVGSAPGVPNGKSGLLQIDSSGAVTDPAGYPTLIDDATGDVSITGGASDGQLVVAGKGGLVFGAGAGVGSVFAGGGNNVAVVGSGDGSQFIALGNGSDTVAATGGNDTVSGGNGTNLIFLGAGADSVTTGGNATLVGGTGTAIVTATGASILFVETGQVNYTIAAEGNGTVLGSTGATSLDAEGSALLFSEGSVANVTVGSGSSTTIAGGTATTSVISNGVVLAFGASGTLNVEANTGGRATVVGGAGTTDVTANGTALAFAGTGAMDFLGGSGNATIVGSAAGNSTLFGGSGHMFGFTRGNTDYIGGSGSDTILGLGGNLTVQGGSGSGLFFGSSGGGNVMMAGNGAATIVGGGSGDVLGADGSGSAVVFAGSGAETITGANSSGTNSFVASSGNDVLRAGFGINTLVDGTGADTMVAGGTTLIVLDAGHGANVQVQDFVSGRTFVDLEGFGLDASSNALAGASVANGSETISLSDGTHVTFVNFTGLHSASFL
ncbi:MAG TPA: NF038122 family metalloprotease [Acetobacteraceae bacterium]|jgi:Ca2+-binding RTX toxin-like protein